MYDPMFNHVANNLKNGIKEIERIGKYTTYECYAPLIAESMMNDLQSYVNYLNRTFDNSK